ncbi:MAG: hypothetical protein IT385_11760 [Deltaproteobacteria bacterium]|nr:hypothetical protein [Deltaproteobacteria bacterium]
MGDDAISIVFANAQTGTFDLAGSTPGDCRRCVWFEADQGTGAASIWLAVAGTLTVSRAPDQALEVTLTDAVLAEVEGGALVADGACYGVDALALEGDIPCEPDCAGKICGGDGCGGTCGPGCEFTQTCNASQTACVGPTPSCPIVSFPSVLFPAGVQVVAAETATNIGGSTSDYVQIYVRTDAKGEFDLASGVNSSFATCEQCILLSEDDGETWFFQYRGELTVDEDTRIFDDPPVFEGEVYDVLLREVTIDPNTYVSTWVPGGRCYRIDNRYVWTD